MIYDTANRIQHCLSWMNVIIITIVHGTPKPKTESNAITMSFCNAGSRYLVTLGVVILIYLITQTV